MAYSTHSDWKTTKGNVALDAHWAGVDDAAQAHAQLKILVERDYPGAVVIGSATRGYNCHAFVHASSHAWFNDISPFLRDDYFQFTPGTLKFNDAVVYVKNGEITHSGFIIQLNGNNIVKVRSKWGAWPLIEHPPTSVPDIYGSIRYYLRRRGEAVSGDSVLGDDAQNAVLSTLIETMTESDRLMELWLASTPNMAEEIIMGWPEYLDLQIGGGITTDLFTEMEARASRDAKFVLSVFAKHSSDPELRALGTELFAQFHGIDK